MMNTLDAKSDSRIYFELDTYLPLKKSANMPTNRVFRCFIIGPMKDDPDDNGLHWLQRLDRELIEPIMKDIGLDYKVTTPFDLHDPYVMEGVIAEIDSADIVIADLTGANANVYYEVCLAHALGKEVILIGEEPTFDLKGLRYVPLKQNATQNSMGAKIRNQLIGALKESHNEIAAFGTPTNPITRYYGTSLTRASSTVAVAETYFMNFLKPAVDSWTEMNNENTEHLYPIQRKMFVDGKDVLISMGKSRDTRKRLRLNVVIPDRIEIATKASINRLRGTTKTKLQEFLLSARHRSLTVNTLFDERKGTFQFWDIPTPIEGLQRTIERRMRTLDIKKNSDEWIEREVSEINLFADALERRIINDESPIYRDNIRIVRFYVELLKLRKDDVKQRAPELVWMVDGLTNAR
jgi:hypothetical protein